MQADRRRINAPAGGTAPPVFATPPDLQLSRPTRTRQPEEHRKIFLRTGVVPSASGSAYYEIPPETSRTPSDILVPSSSSLKITCTVHGPRPLPRNAAFSPNMLLTTHVKFAPFATRQRRGYVRDASERDLGVHLETALRGVIIGERWPKSGCEVVITVLEGEEDGWWGEAGEGGKGGGWGMMNVLAGCITVASAALADAGIDCVDLVSGGVAALTGDGKEGFVLDPSPSEHDVRAACVVGYLQSRDEITELWLKGDSGAQSEMLMDRAVKAATLTRTVLAEAVKEAAEVKFAKAADATNAQDALKLSRSRKTRGLKHHHSNPTKPLPQGEHPPFHHHNHQHGCPQHHHQSRVGLRHGRGGCRRRRLLRDLVRSLQGHCAAGRQILRTILLRPLLQTRRGRSPRSGAARRRARHAHVHGVQERRKGAGGRGRQPEGAGDGDQHPRRRIDGIDRLLGWNKMSGGEGDTMGVKHTDCVARKWEEDVIPISYACSGG